MSEEVASRTRGLRTGWSTGTCASAAAKAAVWALVHGEHLGTVEVPLPNNRRRVTFTVTPAGMATAVVVKNAGDDPDCTDGARITAHAAWLLGGGDLIRLTAGPGVGTVTKNGLGLPVGAPAINPVPRRMIEKCVREVTDRPVSIEISVPGGEEMARQTTNERLGIVGGISILGTNGIVRPFSTASYRASVVQQVDVAAAQGEKVIVLATGHRSESCAVGIWPELDPVCFVEVGDFTGLALRRCARRGIGAVHFVGMAGKIAKLAAGVMMTHFHRSEVDTDVLERAALESSASESVVQAATATTTARHFFEACLAEDARGPLTLLCDWARTACQDHVKGKLPVDVLMVDYEGSAVIARA
ncbi:MAG: cobalt-precorrin-5B (C(1))-methyltransferase [Acidimicrobiales bacterium]